MCQISEHMQPCLDGSVLLVCLQKEKKKKEKKCLFVLREYSLCLTEDAKRGKGSLSKELKTEGKIPLRIHFYAWNLKVKVRASFQGV